MIIFTDLFRDLVEDTASDLRFPRLLYQNYGFDAAVTDVTASSEAIDAPGDAPLNPDTAEYWEPASLPATWTLDLGIARTIDYFAIASHTLGHNGCSIEVKASEDGEFDNYVLLPDASGNYVSTPDSTELNSLTGDLDIIIQVSLNEWVHSTLVQALLSNYVNATSGGFQVYLNGNTGTISFTASDGSGSTSAASTYAPVAVDSGPSRYIRVTLDADNGAAGHDITFYESVDGATWEFISGTTSGGTFFPAAASTDLKLMNDDLSQNTAGRIYKAIVKDGIDGTVVVNFDAEDGDTDDTTIVSSDTGETWTLTGSGVEVVSLRLGYAAMLSEDAPIAFLDESRSARYLRLTVAGSSDAPRIGIIYTGASLVMERMIEGSFQPIALARQTQLENSLSRGGHFLGQNIRRNGFTGGASFKLLTDSWYRANFDPFVIHARSLPYFYLWNPRQHISDIVFAWTTEDIRPQKMGTHDYLSVNWVMYGQG